MTNPNDPQNGFNGTGDSGSTPYGGANNDPQFPSYGSTGDNNNQYGQSQYGQSQYGQNEYGQNQYGQDQYGQDQYGNQYYDQGYANENAASQAGVPLVTNNGPVPVTEAFTFGFKRLFTSQWHVYIGLALIPMLVSLVGSLFFVGPMMAGYLKDPENYIPGPGAFGGMAAFGLVALVASIAFNIVLEKVALQDTDGVKPTWENAFKNVPWGQGILAHVLVGLAFGLALALLFGLSIGLFFVVPALGVLLGLVTLIGAIFLMPFATMIPLYAIDGRTSATGAFGAAFKDVKANYWPVLGALILIGLLAGVANNITQGFSALIFTPVTTLVAVFLYRWITNRNTEMPPQQDGYMSMY